MKTPQQKPFWEDMRNPITMQKVTKQDDPNKTAYNKAYYKNQKQTL